jgi:Peptidase family M28
MRRLTLLTAAALLPAVVAAQPVQKDAAPTADGVVPAPDTKLPLKHAPQPTSAAISAKDLMTRLYIFADDSMQGREAGTAGNVKGTDYIAREVQRLGLKPAGENGTYFQTLPFKTRTIEPTSSITVAGAPLAYGTDWLAAGPGALTGTDLPVIYGGAVSDTATALTPEQVAGKFVVFNVAPGAGMRGSRASGRLVQAAAGVAIIMPAQYLPFVSRPQQFIDDPNNAPPAGVALRPTVYLTQSGAMKLFPGATSAPATGTAGASVTLDVRSKTEPAQFPARNVVAILPGSDPKLAGEYVAIGAHNDHVGFNNRPVDHDSIRIFNHLVRPGGAEDQGKQATPEQQAEVNKQLAAYRAAHPGTARLDSIFNGADDDGTGSVSVLEIAEKMASRKGAAAPKRSILFIWHVGEEKGLWGSAYFTDHPTVPRDSIVAELNMDMEGRGDAWDETGKTKEGAAIHGNGNYLQLIGSRRLSTELGDLVEQVNKEGKHGFTFDYSLDANGHPMNIYCRSDHYEYARYGIPIVFFTTGGHSDYHQVTDEPQYIDYPHMERVVTLVDDIAMHVANRPTRPTVDQPKMDPHGRCMQ